MHQMVFPQFKQRDTRGRKKQEENRKGMNDRRKTIDWRELPQNVERRFFLDCPHSLLFLSVSIILFHTHTYTRAREINMAESLSLSLSSHPSLSIF